MRFKKIDESLIEGKKIAFIPVFPGANGNLVDKSGVDVGATLTSGSDLRNEMDPFANGKDTSNIDPNHYIPKAEWDGISDGNIAEAGLPKEQDPNTRGSKAKAKGGQKGQKKEEERWENLPQYHVDDETGEEMVYQICVTQESPNFGKGRWVSFDDAIG